MDVGDVVAVFRGVEPDFIGGPMNNTTFESAAGHPDTESKDMMIATVRSLSARSSSELGGKDDEGLVEEPALVEVGQEATDGLIDGQCVTGVIGFECTVGIPSACATTAMLDLDEPNSLFDKAASGEELHAELAAMWFIEAVKSLGSFGFLPQIDDARHRLLHSEGELIGSNACGGREIIGVFDSAQLV